MEDQVILDIKDVIENSKHIVVTSHGAPDGDSIGSALALCHYLKLIGKNVDVIIPDDAPKFLRWMPGYQDIHVHLNNRSHCEKIMKKADVLFCLDFNALKRLFKLAPSAEASNTIKVVIDHHRDPDSFPDHIISKPLKSSTCEMIYDLIVDLTGDEIINNDIATCIYTGIMTDTGSFKYSCTTPETHEVAAQLIRKGVSNAEIGDKIFGAAKEDTVKLLGFCLSEKLVVRKEFNTAYMSLSQEELDSHNFEKGDTEGFVNYGLSIHGIRFVAFFIVFHDVVKISFRSTGDFATNEFSGAHFSGGGHRNASGGISHDSL
ncbi:MAG: DHH family phosphoesterase, partial [Flavobacteriales bacterium]|nr:DHH family phosphoesterase [Flavobacteriales bacterium]